MSEKFEQFLCLIEELELEEFLPCIVNNGFDDWEAVKELNSQLLIDCSICTDPTKIQQILACVEGAGSYDFKKVIKEVTVKERRVNEIGKIDILKGTTKKKDKDMCENKFLNNINVVSLSDKKYEYIGDEMRLCCNLKTLQLFSNRLLVIDNIENLQKLTSLQLDSNCITRITGLASLFNLQKLYLNKNRIVKLEGLENLTNLKELQMNNQQIGNVVLTFEEVSMAGIGSSLESFECMKNNVNDIDMLSHLNVLSKLQLANNCIDKFDNCLGPLGAMKQLTELTLKGNPISTVQKYRDRMVLMSKSLEELDGKLILSTEREFLLNLWRKKHGLLDEKKQEGGEPGNTRKKGCIDPSKILGTVEGKTIQPMWTDDKMFKNPTSYQKLNVANDVRGNQPLQSTKHTPSIKNNNTYL